MSEELEQQGAVRPVDMNALQDVSKKTSLEDVRLMQFSASSQRPIHESEDNLEHIIKYRADLLGLRDARLLFGRVEFAYTSCLADEDLNEVTGTYLVIYRASPEYPLDRLDDDALLQYVEVMGVLNTWPYIREVVASSLMRLGVPGVTLPTWRIPKNLPPRGEYASFVKEAKRDRLEEE